jgi:hypothetical protein
LLQRNGCLRFTASGLTGYSHSVDARALPDAIVDPVGYLLGNMPVMVFDDDDVAFDDLPPSIPRSRGDTILGE